jgi:hypothetical protein
MDAMCVARGIDIGSRLVDFTVDCESCGVDGLVTDYWKGK